jgi:alkylation response protein AidB-like acyl-CoA dehydrogenase
MRLTEEQKKQIVERLAEAALLTLRRPTQYSGERENLQAAFLEELEKIESETKEAGIEETKQATGTGSKGTFDY